MSRAALESCLAKGIRQLQLPVTASQQQQLLAYVGLLEKWNRAYNLTAVRDPHDMVVRHLLDALSILPCIDRQQPGVIADVGSGAGIPGIPLAICLPEERFVLLDSNGKKTRFLRQVVVELGLGNVEVVQGRLEQWQPREPVKQVTSRAFAELAQLVDWCLPLAQKGAQLLAMKAGLEECERSAVADDHLDIRIVELKVPFLPEVRQLVQINWIDDRSHKLNNEE